MPWPPATPQEWAQLVLVVIGGLIGLVIVGALLAFVLLIVGLVGGYLFKHPLVTLGFLAASAVLGGLVLVVGLAMTGELHGSIEAGVIVAGVAFCVLMFMAAGEN